jgi:hypothetical protein
MEYLNSLNTVALIKNLGIKTFDIKKINTIKKAKCNITQTLNTNR